MPGGDAYPRGPPVINLSRTAATAVDQRGTSARGTAALASALDTAIAQPGRSAQHAEHLA